MGTHSEHAHEHHVTPPSTYVKVLGLLLILTGITVAASYVHFGSGAANVVIALTIATIKASLVGLFFMHLRHDNPLNAVIFCSSLGFLGLLLGFTLIDNSSRVHIVPSTGFMSPLAPAGGPKVPVPANATPAGAPAPAVPGATPAATPATAAPAAGQPAATTPAGGQGAAASPATAPTPTH